VANHLLKNLTASPCYLINKNCSGKGGDSCFCGDEACKITGSYGDTSIGKNHLIQAKLILAYSFGFLSVHVF
jgi:hypothetical protein